MVMKKPMNDDVVMGIAEDAEGDTVGARFEGGAAVSQEHWPVPPIWGRYSQSDTN
jgi:hypothetical protein